MDICWPHKTTMEYSRLLSSKEFKHLLMLFGTGVTEGTHVAMGFARVCKHKSVVTFVILMPYVRHLTLISMAQKHFFYKYINSSQLRSINCCLVNVRVDGISHFNRTRRGRNAVRHELASDFSGERENIGRNKPSRDVKKSPASSRRYNWVTIHGNTNISDCVPSIQIYDQLSERWCPSLRERDYSLPNGNEQIMGGARKSMGLGEKLQRVVLTSL